MTVDLEFIKKQINTMYAIIADGGRQYKVEEGQELEIGKKELGIS